MYGLAPFRALLLLCLVVSGGCVSVSDTPDTATTQTTATTENPMTATTTETTTTSSRTTPDGTHRRWIRGRAVAVTAADIAERTSFRLSETAAADRPLYHRAITNGSARGTVLGDRDDPPRCPVVVNGTYYAINRTEIASELVTVHRFSISGPVDEGTDEHATATDEGVAFENLSAIDRKVFSTGMPSEGTEGFYLEFDYRFENATPPDASRLADADTVYVRFEGEYYRVTFERTRTVHRITYRYTASAVANSTEAYAEIATDRYVTNVSNVSLSGEARKALVRMIRNGSIEYETRDPGFPTHLERLYEWSTRHRFVEYRGEYYAVQVSKVVE